MFGQSLQSVRVPNIWTLKLKNGSFFGQLWIFGEYGILMASLQQKLMAFLSLFFNLFLLQMLLLFIGKRFVHMSSLSLQDSMLWFGWITKIKPIQVLHSPKMKYQSFRY